MSIFKESEAYRPFSYSWAVEAEKKHRIDMFWHENQIELQDDLRQYTSKEGMKTANVAHEVNKGTLDKLLMLFTEMDASVASGYCKLLPHVGNNEIRTLWMTFASREVTHQRAYALSAETFGFSSSDWSGFKDYKEMQDKIDIISQEVGDLSKPVNFAKALVVLLLGEGISLFGAFACLLNLRRFGLVQNFNTINEWSLKDEQEHVTYNIRILGEVRKQLSVEDSLELDAFIHETVKGYVDAEKRFLELVFELGDQEGLSLENAKEFIEYLGELRLYQLGLIPSQKVRENPLSWIDYVLSGSSHTNFFEARVVDYTHNGLAGKVDYSKYNSLLDR